MENYEFDTPIGLTAGDMIFFLKKLCKNYYKFLKLLDIGSSVIRLIQIPLNSNFILSYFLNLIKYIFIKDINSIKYYTFI